MFHPYRTLFSLPATRAFALAGLLARIPLPMTGIGIIAMLSQLHGSYALAGTVSATFVLTYALLSPQISRLADRYGQHRVLPLATLISVTGLLLLTVSAWREATVWSLLACAILAGFMPSISAMIRARWTALHKGQPHLQTAYSLETVFDEVSFITGPPLSVGLSVVLVPPAGLLMAALLLLTGTFALVLQRATEPPVIASGHVTARTRSILCIPGVRLLTLLMMAMGVIVGTVDIVSIAFAEQRGQPAAASLVLSVYALGSCLSGLLFGAFRISLPLRRLLLIGALATAATTLPLYLAGSLPTLVAAVLVAGLFFAPTMIIAMSMVERLVPWQNLTEGMTWLLAGLNAGVALGAALAGQAVDHSGTSGGFAVALCAGALVLLLTLSGCRHLPGHSMTSIDPSSSPVTLEP